MAEMPEWAMQLAGYLLAAGGLYGGIRADLKHATAAAASAHRRIDDHLTDHVSGVFSHVCRRGCGGENG